MIGEILDDILFGKCKIRDFLFIKVIKKKGLWVIVDN